MTDRDARYREASGGHEPEPAAFLVENVERLPREGIALDVAMGEGRNAIYLALRGFEVYGMDRSLPALLRARARAAALGRRIRLVALDHERSPLPAARFDVACVFNYLQRDLCPAIAAALRPGGALVYETFTGAHRRYRSTMNPAFLLGENELLRTFLDLGLRIAVYREVDLPAEGRAVASLLAYRPAP